MGSRERKFLGIVYYVNDKPALAEEESASGLSVSRKLFTLLLLIAGLGFGGPALFVSGLCIFMYRPGCWVFLPVLLLVSIVALISTIFGVYLLLQRSKRAV